jgi:hypothetical protein
MLGSGKTECGVQGLELWTGYLEADGEFDL